MVKTPRFAEEDSGFQLTPKSRIAAIGRTDFLDEPWLWDHSDWGSEGSRTRRSELGEVSRLQF